MWRSLRRRPCVAGAAAPAVPAAGAEVLDALLRDPWDAELLAPGVLGVTAYGWRKCQLDAVIARLCH